MRYEWKEGWRPSGVKAEAAARELARIRRVRGSLEAPAVLAEIRRRGQRSALFDAVFHVGEAEAAERYYVERVRKIIQAVG